MPPHYSTVELKAKAFGWRIEECWMEGESSTFYRKNHIVLECVHEDIIQWAKYTVDADRVIEREYNPDIRILLEIDDKIIKKEPSSRIC